MINLMENDNDGMNKPSEWRVYSVGELTREIKYALEEGFPPLWVEGEISNFKRHSSGHFYFSLKDLDAHISCVMWRGKTQFLPFELIDGMKIIVFGNISVYERQGRYQIIVHRIKPVGVGDLQAAFEVLKQRLKEEGLFNPEHKKTLPSFPMKIGIVTSPTGAAIRDIVSIIERRFPAVQLILSPVKVQGDGASEEIVKGIKQFNDYSDVNVIIVGRGGGSVEDLWAFNEENVARAIFESKIPIISAVGHEIDFAISDFVADVRAATPSAAAELVVKNREDILYTLSNWKVRIFKCVLSKIQYHREQLNSVLRSYGFRFPLNLILEYRQRIDDLSRILGDRIVSYIEMLRTNLNQRSGLLESLNPMAVLNRGYSITTHITDQKVIKSSSQVKKEDHLRIRFAQGTVRSIVEKVDE